MERIVTGMFSKANQNDYFKEYSKLLEAELKIIQELLKIKDSEIQ